MRAHPWLAEAVTLVSRAGGAYASASDADRACLAVRIHWQLRFLPWVGLTTAGLVDDYDCSDHLPQPLLAIVCWADTDRAQAWAPVALERYVAEYLPLPLGIGPDLYLLDVAVAPGAGPRAVRALWRAVRMRRPDARRVAWHRQRPGGRRRFSLLQVRAV